MSPIAFINNFFLTSSSASAQVSFWENFQGHRYMTAGVNSIAPGTLSMQHVIIPLSIAYGLVHVGFSNSTNTGTASFSFGLYTSTAGTLSLISSASGTTAWAAALNQLVSLSSIVTGRIAPGEYYLGLVHSTNANNTSNGLWFGQTNINNSITNTTLYNPRLYGVHSVSTSALPATLSTSDVAWAGLRGPQQPFIVITA